MDHYKKYGGRGWATNKTNKNKNKTHSHTGGSIDLPKY